MLRPELRGDTIFLIPNTNALREVVVWGERRFDRRMAGMMRLSPEQEKDIELQQAIPAGFNPVAFALWLYNQTLRGKVEERRRRKKALREVRRQEAEYERMWNELEKKTTDTSGVR